MGKVLVFGFVFFMMFSLVAGAGYSVTVPSVVTETPSSGGGGGGGTTVVANATANDTATAGADADDDADAGDGNVVTKTIDEAVEFVKKLGWKSVALTLVSLAVIGGAIWYFLKDRRKGFIQIKVKGKK